MRHISWIRAFNFSYKAFIATLAFPGASTNFYSVWYPTMVWESGTLLTTTCFNPIGQWGWRSTDSHALLSFQGMAEYLCNANGSVLLKCTCNFLARLDTHFQSFALGYESEPGNLCQTLLTKVQLPWLCDEEPLPLKIKSKCMMSNAIYYIHVYVSRKHKLESSPASTAFSVARCHIILDKFRVRPDCICG